MNNKEQWINAIRDNPPETIADIILNDIERINKQAKEIERLNNVIDELEKELKEDYKIWMCNSRSNGKSVKFGIDVCKTHFYNRLQELKGDKNNDN